MWDFSWLTRRHGAEAEYADWDKVLDELANRGYDCVRTDAFPRMVAGGPGSGETFTVLPEPHAAKWGNHVPPRSLRLNRSLTDRVDPSNTSGQSTPEENGAMVSESGPTG